MNTFDKHIRLDGQASHRLSSSRMRRSRQQETRSMAEGIGKLPLRHWRKARIRALDDGQTFQEVFERVLVDCLRTPVKRGACA